MSFSLFFLWHFLDLSLLKIGFLPESYSLFSGGDHFSLTQQFCNFGMGRWDFGVLAGLCCCCPSPAAPHSTLQGDRLCSWLAGLRVGSQRFITCHQSWASHLLYSNTPKHRRRGDFSPPCDKSKACLVLEMPQMCVFPSAALGWGAQGFPVYLPSQVHLIFLDEGHWPGTVSHLLPESCRAGRPSVLLPWTRTSFYCSSLPIFLDPSSGLWPFSSFTKTSSSFPYLYSCWLVSERRTRQGNLISGSLTVILKNNNV